MGWGWGACGGARVGAAVVQTGRCGCGRDGGDALAGGGQRALAWLDELAGWLCRRARTALGWPFAVAAGGRANLAAIGPPGLPALGAQSRGHSTHFRPFVGPRAQRKRKSRVPSKSLSALHRQFFTSAPSHSCARGQPQSPKMAPAVAAAASLVRETLSDIGTISLRNRPARCKCPRRTRPFCCAASSLARRRPSPPARLCPLLPCAPPPQPLLACAPPPPPRTPGPQARCYQQPPRW